MLETRTFFDAIFFGFAIYSFMFLMVKWFPFYKKNKVFEKIETAAISVISLSGLIYAILILFDWTAIYFGNDTELKNHFMHRLKGPYGFGLWFQPFVYIILTQLLRIKKVSRNFILRFVIAFLLFFNFEKFVIIVTSLHRDYLPSSWTMYDDYSVFGWIIADWILKMIIFSSFVTVAYYIKNRKTF